VLGSSAVGDNPDGEGLIPQVRLRLQPSPEAGRVDSGHAVAGRVDLARYEMGRGGI
jgi:hypothetical protein